MPVEWKNGLVAPTTDPVAWLRSIPPFDDLPRELFKKAADTLEILYFPRGTTVLTEEGPASAHVWIVRKGVVRFHRQGHTVMTIEEGELFGVVSILTGEVPYDVTVEEDLLAYRIPDTVFRELLREPRFAGHFALGLAARLKGALAPPATTTLGVDLFEPVEALVMRAPITVPSDATVGDAARKMREEGISSVLVEGNPPAILTDRDLRNRVLAQDLCADVPARRVATSPVFTLPAATPVYGAWQSILGHGVHHLPVERDGRIIGVVTDSDLLRHHASGPVAVLKRVERMRDRTALPGYAEAVGRMVNSLFEAGLDVPPIGQLVARTNDALCRALLRFAEEDLGPPPCPYAFIVFGSEGRMEQTLLTDQDNALVYAEESERASGYFPELARRVAADLAAAGVPPCAGGYMATAWQGPLVSWEARFGSWIDRPTGEAMLHVANFFDFRRTHGDLDLAALDALVLSAKGNDRFRAFLLAEGLRFKPPLGAFGRLRDSGEGIDLKKSGLVPIVTLARVYALEAGSPERGTLERLAAARAAGILSPDGEEELGEAFRYFLRLRLREQLRALAAREAPSGRLHPDALSSLERARLKESFRAVREAQDAAALRYRTDRF